jgi:hypothetical protein
MDTQPRPEVLEGKPTQQSQRPSQGTLVSRDEVGEVRGGAVCRSLGENLTKAMNEANGAVVRK